MHVASLGCAVSHCPGGRRSKLFSVRLVELPAGPLFGLTLTSGAFCARAAEAVSATAHAATMRAAAPRRAGESARITGGGYVQAGVACYRSSSTAACPLGQKARKSHRRHQGPAAAG